MDTDDTEPRIDHKLRTLLDCRDEEEMDEFPAELVPSIEKMERLMESKTVPKLELEVKPKLEPKKLHKTVPKMEPKNGTTLNVGDKVIVGGVKVSKIDFEKNDSSQHHDYRDHAHR